MELFKSIVSRIIDISDTELHSFVNRFSIVEFKRNGMLSQVGKVPDEVFFIERGLVRVIIQDGSGVEHTIHFAMEGQFIADYASYLRKQPANYSIQAIEDTRVVVLSRGAIDWGYANLSCGEQLGRRLAEFYFSIHDDRIKMSYLMGPRERYNEIEHVHPGILSRIPQHMIASYLGISSVHLSRLKKQK
jgi:CRP-like cAMP-binding protein